jgi:hypothetical protein
MARKTNKARGGPRHNPDKKPPSFCANCGGPVSNAGKASADGKRFCSQRQCQAAKSARHRARAAATRPDRDAPANCTICNAALPQRKWRAGDDVGRFCRKVTCRRRRDEIRAGLQADQVPALMQKAERLENAVFLLAEAVQADSEFDHAHGRKICMECGLTTGLKDWPHRNREGAPCRGLVEKGAPKRPVDALHLDMAWPFVREYLEPDHLVALRNAG